MTQMTTIKWLDELEQRLDEVIRPLEDLGLEPLATKLDELINWLVEERTSHEPD